MRLFIVDDHVLFREGLASILGHETDIEIVGLAGSVAEAIDQVGKLKPDVVLMDFGLGDGTGPDATRQILRQLPNTKIIFLTMSEDDESLFDAVRSGAKGYLLKDMRPAKLLSAIRAVYQGESAISRAMTLRLMEELGRTRAIESPSIAPVANLTPRETDVLRELATGDSNQEIADRLFLSENTVKYHVHAILKKLGLKDRIEAAKFAREHGLGK